MKNHEPFRFSLGVVGYPLFLVLTIWVVFWFEVRFRYNFSDYGIYPTTLSGLKGVLISPFIHSSIQHLFHNSIPLLVLTMALFYFYRPIAWKVLVFGILISGFFTWCIGRPSYHIGASGLIYVLVSFIFFKGVFTKFFRLIALSLLVVFLYGSMIWYALPLEDGISWEGHLSGLVTGLLFALFFKKNIAKPEKYDWELPNFKDEDDSFLKHFDENGYFIENISEEEETSTKINYNFKSDDH